MQESHRVSLPEVASSFVGRSSELSSIESQFDEGARLVTIVAPGGMGKTRLALRFAADRGGAYGDLGGPWFCDLTEADGAAAMCVIVASTLGVRLERERDVQRLVEAVGDAIARKKRLLLVLDNVEHIAGDAARVVAAWMSAAADARFLVTSRVVLGVAGEHLAPLEPLFVPPAGPNSGAAEHDAWARSDGIALFLSRARQVNPSFAPTGGDLEAIADIVRSVDGIPLAIELAAARLRVLSLDQMRARLRAPLGVLVKQNDDGRHASMRRTVTDSVLQLDADEHRCFAACSLFKGGFSLEAAEDVVGQASGASTLDLLESLVSRSLVRATKVGDRTRFSMFEVIRELAQESLRARPELADAVAARHCRYYARITPALAEQAAFDRAIASALDRELDNLLAAHNRACAEAAADPFGEGPMLALTLALALEPGLAARGSFAARVTLLDRALAVQPTLSGSAAITAIVVRGAALHELGDSQAGARDLEQGLACARALSPGEPAAAELEAAALLHLAEITEASGDTAGARQQLSAALERLARARPGRVTRVREADILARLGHALRREGDLPAAEAATQRALALYREVGIEERLPRILYEAGVIGLFRAAYDAAMAHFDEGLKRARALQDKQAEGALQSGIGVLLQERGDLDDAIVHHAAAVRAFHELGNRHREISALYYLGGAFLERGSHDEAIKLLVRAFDRMGGAGMRRYEVLIGGALASASAMVGQLETARGWLVRAKDAALACESERALQLALTIHEAHVAGRDSLSAAPTEAVVATLQHALEQNGNDDARFAWRLLAQARAPSSSSPPTREERALRVRGDGGAFCLPDTSTFVDLSRRAPLKRILLALAQLRVESPGEALATDDVIRAGWPGERIGAVAAANRVRVALATLRKLGLRDRIVTGEGGYLLDPAIPVVVVR